MAAGSGSGEQRRWLASPSTCTIGDIRCRPAVRRSGTRSSSAYTEFRSLNSPPKHGAGSWWLHAMRGGLEVVISSAMALGEGSAQLCPTRISRSAAGDPSSPPPPCKQYLVKHSDFSHT